MSSDGRRCEVTFQPGKPAGGRPQRSRRPKRSHVAAGESLLAAARAAGVRLHSECGGDGLCGKCKVIVRRGSVSHPATPLLSTEEVARNCVLACRALVEGEVEVEVPGDAESASIVTDSAAAHEPEAPTDPLVDVVELQLAAPTIDDPRADLDRLTAGVRAATGAEHVRVGYGVMRGMHDSLRAADWHVAAVVAEADEAVEVIRIDAADGNRANHAVAVDVGTTTVAAALLDLRTGRTIATEAAYNPQAGCGEDYIRRIIYAEEHDAFGEMQRLIVGAINELIASLAGTAGIDVHDVRAAACCGNTVMIHFLLGLPARSIRREPYVPVATAIPPLRAADVGVQINPEGLLYCLPGVAAYVGSDITAGVVAAGLDETRDVCLFIDVGTNGEVMLGNREWMVCCSASAGPAFEGGGVACGMRAERGAIEHVRISGGGEVSIETIGGAPARGICGTGLIDALAQMRRAGIIDRAGRLQPEHPAGRVRRSTDGREFVLSGTGQAANAGSDVVITQADIDNLVRSKAAVCAAVDSLLGSVGSPLTGIKRVILAGGFGSSLDPANAVELGLLPPVPPEIVTFAGNTALAGTRQALLSKAFHRRIRDVSRRMTYIDLMTDPRYMESFQAACFIPHTNAERYHFTPTVT